MSRSGDSGESLGQPSDAVKAIFRMCDRNGDGLVQRGELEGALRQLGRWSNDEFDVLFSRADSNGNGVLEYDEFVDWIFGTKNAKSASGGMPAPPQSDYFQQHGLVGVFAGMAQGLETAHPEDPLAWMMRYLADQKRKRDAPDAQAALAASSAANVDSGAALADAARSQGPRRRVNTGACLRRTCKPMLDEVLSDPIYEQVEDIKAADCEIYFVWDGKSLLSRLGHPGGRDDPRELPVDAWVNRLPGMGGLCDKVNMTLALRLLQQLWPEKFRFFPRSWLLPLETTKLRDWLSRHKGETVIVKPADGSQGDGIFLVRDPQDLECKLAAKPHWGAGFGALAQTYVPSPLLLDGLKFDLRLYAVVTSIDPLKAYLCKEGLARFCTAKYEAPTAENANQIYMHLTNYAVNKRSPNFVYNDDPFSANTAASKRPLSTLMAQIDAHEEAQGRKFDEAKFFSACEEVVVVLLQSVAPVLKVTYNRVAAEAQREAKAAKAAKAKSKAKPKGKAKRKSEDSDEEDEESEEEDDDDDDDSDAAFEPNCFQVLGVDVLLDERLQPWLLEVNARPSMEIDTAVRLSEAPEGTRRCVCRDMDGEEHAHIRSEVDVYVKRLLTAGAFELCREDAEVPKGFFEMDFDKHSPSEAQETVQAIARIYEVAASGQKHNAFTTSGARRALAGAVKAGMSPHAIDTVVQKWKHQGYREEHAAEEDTADIAVLDFAGLLQEVALARAGPEADPLEALTELIDLCDPELS